MFRIKVGIFLSVLTTTNVLSHCNSGCPTGGIRTCEKQIYHVVQGEVVSRITAPLLVQYTDYENRKNSYAAVYQISSEKGCVGIAIQCKATKDNNHSGNEINCCISDGKFDGSKISGVVRCKPGETLSVHWSSYTKHKGEMLIVKIEEKSRNKKSLR